MTQHQYEQRCFSSHVHLLPTSMALSLPSCLSASTPLPQHPTATTPTTTTTTTTIITTTPPPCVWQSHSRPCVCWRRYIMPSFHCTPDQREQSSTENLLLADFFFLSSFFHHHIVLSDFSTRGLYSRPRYYPLQHSSSCWKPNRANGRGVNDQRFQCFKKKRLEEIDEMW